MLSYESGPPSKGLSNELEWLRRRQGVLLPIQPPTSKSSRTFYFKNVQNFTRIPGKSIDSINFQEFAVEWNTGADEGDRFYVTPDLLRSFAVTWHKIYNAKSSESMSQPTLDGISEMISDSSFGFPENFSRLPVRHSGPPGGRLQGAGDLPPQEPRHPREHGFIGTVYNYTEGCSAVSTATPSEHSNEATIVTSKNPRSRALPLDQRVRAQRTCRRCSRNDCPGASPRGVRSQPATIPCRKCNQLLCRGADGRSGYYCTKNTFH